ncbi:ArnT family glycosyltransferase [Fontivita pretiosa]|uniref:ArnT family glycosyltransferase n=1 Tax=Fontivita pretiosa TaxID=2989684 RepID=UPI003D1809C9
MRRFELTVGTKLVLTLLVAAAAIAALLLQVGWIIGPGWVWFYRPLPAALVYPFFAAAAVPFFVAQLLDRWRRSLRWLAILLLMVCCYAMKLAAVAFRGDVTEIPNPSLALVRITVENKYATSYYTDALAVSNVPLREWMALYPQLTPAMNLHTQSKPPGPVLYYVIFLKLLGDTPQAALIAGLVLGVIATFSIPATYLFLRHLLGDDESAFCGASFLSLCPGFILFFPMFDPTYILFSTALIGCWYSALRDDRIKPSILLGVVLGLMCLITFNVLVIGLFMVGMIFIVSPQRPMILRIGIAAKHAAIALLTTAAVLLLLWISINYDPVATFISAWRNQHALLRAHADQRPYPDTIAWDLIDFALGSGWISVPLVIFYFIGTHAGTRRPHLPLVILALGQLVAVAVSGLLQLETARVWNFMLPLLMIPVGLELRRWPVGARLTCFAALALVTAAIHQNVKFIF